MNKEIYVCGLQTMNNYKFVMCPAVAFTDRESAIEWCKKAGEQSGYNFVHATIMLKGEFE